MRAAYAREATRHANSTKACTHCSTGRMVSLSDFSPEMSAHKKHHTSNPAYFSFDPEYYSMVTIPAGARSIRVEEMAVSTSYLAVRSLKRKYYLTGDWTVDWPGKFHFGGATFSYQRSFSKPESLYAAGPTNETLVFEVRLMSNLCIKSDISSSYFVLSSQDRDISIILKIFFILVIKSRHFWLQLFRFYFLFFQHLSLLLLVAHKVNGDHSAQVSHGLFGLHFFFFNYYYYEPSSLILDAFRISHL